MWGNKPPPIVLSCLRKLDKTRQRRIRHFFLPQCKKAILTDGLSLYLMPGSLWRASCPPPSGRCFATFKSAPGGFVLLRRAFTDKQQIKQKAQSFD
ncbi:hypothetical protein CF57_30535 [Escherichia coli]|nr:hypothetical protein CF57_30535 [Escherichia coli]